MEKFKLTKGDYIQLIQLLKVMGWVNTGGEASYAVSQGFVKVQNIVEFRLRNKIRVGMIVEFDNQKVEVV
ncbi:MAG: RNA-binding S4 domain-containing protein [Cytophagales bacterium]|nr:MAG: RNA-binding S4 domain-containing protein [Cytophagales bacterium]